jgi:enoyl-CoA hydratase/carnithine racemase
MSDLVLCEKHDGVALLTLNRPRQLNALNYALIDRLISLLDATEDDPHTKAVVLTGAGDKAFSAGADIKEFSQTIEQGPDIALKLFVRRGQAMTARLEAFPKPVIAAVNGLAFGGGCEITEAVHLAVQCRLPAGATSSVTIVCAWQRLFATTASSTGHKLT